MANASMFKTVTGTFQDKKTIDDIKKFVFLEYKEELKLRPSFHKYISGLPQNFQEMVRKVRDSPQIKADICKQYTDCDITALPDTDELYVSHYNIDGGGDQGLFAKHYDGVLRLLNDATVVRALIYVNSNDDFMVHFIDSEVSKNFRTYDYGILDFNREYHWVEGKYDDKMDINDTRILLKINYLVCPKCSTAYAQFVIWLNLMVFYIVKTCMEYSKSPKTVFQYIIGFFCNLFRVVNNISVYLSILLVFAVIAAITGGAYGGVVGGMYLMKKLGARKPRRTRR